MYVMPMSRARLTASIALSSSLYMRKRLPPPNARMDTRAPVLPSTRVGNLCSLPISAAFVTPAAKPPSAVLSRNRRREMLIGFAVLSLCSGYRTALDGSIQLEPAAPGHFLEIELVLYGHPSDHGVKGDFLVFDGDRARLGEEELDFIEAVLG